MNRLQKKPYRTLPYFLPGRFCSLAKPIVQFLLSTYFSKEVLFRGLRATGVMFRVAVIRSDQRSIPFT